MGSIDGQEHRELIPEEQEAAAQPEAEREHVLLGNGDDWGVDQGLDEEDIEVDNDQQQQQALEGDDEELQDPEGEEGQDEYEAQDLEDLEDLEGGEDQEDPEPAQDFPVDYLDWPEAEVPPPDEPIVDDG